MNVTPIKDNDNEVKVSTHTETYISDLESEIDSLKLEVKKLRKVKKKPQMEVKSDVSCCDKYKILVSNFHRLLDDNKTELSQTLKDNIMEYKLIYSVLDLPTFNKEEPVFCDIETDDLYGPLRMIQMYQPSTDPIIYILDIAPIGYNKEHWARELLNLEDALMRLHTVWYNSS